jgi:hypothetical protein
VCKTTKRTDVNHGGGNKTHDLGATTARVFPVAVRNSFCPSDILFLVSELMNEEYRWDRYHTGWER